MSIKKAGFFFATLIISTFARCQCPVADFSVQGGICAGEQVSMINNSANAISYEWDFCSGDFSAAPVASNIAAGVPGPRSFEPVFDGTSWFGFSINLFSTTISRYDFGSSLDSTPVVTDIGNPSNALQGNISNNIQFIKEGGNWYGIYSVLLTNLLVRLDFGNSLSNPSPVATIDTIPFAYQGYQFGELHNDQGDVVLFLGNALTNELTVVNYGNSILNAPVYTAISIDSVTELNSVRIVKTCNEWTGFGISFNTNSVIRLDFGNSLLNTPVQTRINYPNGILLNPVSIDVVNDGKKWELLVQNYTLGLASLDLGNDLHGAVLSDGIAYLTAANFVRAVRTNSNIYLMTASLNTNSIDRLLYAAPCHAVPATSTASSPSVIFTEGGHYNISLTATDAAGNSSVKTDSVDAGSIPDVSFGALNLCLGDSSIFTDSSTISGGMITSRTWHFGDGDTSVLQNPKHRYANSGTFTVTLTVRSSSGCSSQQTKQININPYPQVQFSAPGGCSQTALQFTDNSSIFSGSNVAWKWTFGTGDSSSDENPSYVFTNGGNYLISLLVTSDSGCAAVSSQNVPVNNKPDAEFSAANTCAGQSAEFNCTTSSPSPLVAFHWNFDDGDSANVSNPFHIYSGGVNTYNVQLIIDAANGCSDTIQKAIKINNIPVANFSFASSVCQKNNALFTDLSTVAGDTISSWMWDFGDGLTDTVKDPSHSFSAPGNKTVTLVAYSPSSCPSAPVQQTVSVIESPVAAFSYTEVCFGNRSFFQNLSAIPPGSMLSSLQWQLSTGDTSANDTLSWLFSQPGNYPVILTVTTNDGCFDNDTIVVPVHALPVPAFANSTSCTDQLITFTNQSTADSLSSIVSNLWSFGDPASGTADTSTSVNAVHNFTSPQLYNVSLITTTSFGCSDTVSRLLNIKKSPSVSYSYAPTCFGDLMEFFNPGSPLDSAYLWNFGDGQINQLQSPAHYYAGSGNYNTTLTVTAFNGCVASGNKLVSVSPIPVADFDITPACIGTPFQFSDNSTVSTGSIQQWSWTIGDTTIIGDSPIYTFADTGLHSVSLLVTSDIGCKKTTTKDITVHSLPIANFNFDPQFGNPPMDVQFTDLSTGSYTYLWNFGDESPEVNFFDPMHTYLDTGLFMITETVTNVFGCVDSAVKNIYAIRPLLDIAVTGDSSYLSGDYFHMVARIANLGTRPIDSIKIEARLGNSTQIRESYIHSIPNGTDGMQTYYFTAAFLVSASTDLSYYCIKATEPNGEADNVPSNNEWCVDRTGEFGMMPVYPNPFSADLTFQVNVPAADHLKIELIDAMGNICKTVYDADAAKGIFTFHADYSDLKEGLYLARAVFNDKVFTRAVVKAKSSR